MLVLSVNIGGLGCGLYIHAPSRLSTTTDYNLTTGNFLFEINEILVLANVSYFLLPIPVTLADGGSTISLLHFVGSTILP